MSKFFLTDSQYNRGFELSEYKGEWSLIAARQWEGRDGSMKVSQTWGEIEVSKDKTKHLPVAVKLGSKQNAIDTLKAVLKELENDVPDFREPGCDNDPPF